MNGDLWKRCVEELGIDRVRDTVLPGLNDCMRGRGEGRYSFDLGQEYGAIIHCELKTVEIFDDATGDEETYSLEEFSAMLGPR
jgi:hypothetical protein